jgi:hypothetical protein
MDRTLQDAFFQGMPHFRLPSSLLAKGLPTMADAERLEKIASIGQDLITTQLTMAMQTPSQALEGTWVLGNVRPPLLGTAGKSALSRRCCRWRQRRIRLDR